MNELVEQMSTAAIAALNLPTRDAVEYALDEFLMAERDTVYYALRSDGQIREERAITARQALMDMLVFADETQKEG